MKPTSAIAHGLLLIGAASLTVFGAGVGRSLTATRSAEASGGGSTAVQAPISIAQAAPKAASTSLTQAQIDYFLEIAVGSEYNSESAPKIHKWSGDVRIQVLGKPTAEDLKTLQTVISEINTLTAGAVRLQKVDRAPNLTIHFAPEPQFSRLEPAYTPVNYGFFSTRWDTKGTINRANVLITTTGVTQKERSHLIREELTQSLGLMRDSYRYADSMFYQPWTDVTRYAEIDKALIRTLYRPELKPGMTRAQVLKALNQIQATAPLRF